jgi:cyanate permease
VWVTSDRPTVARRGLLLLAFFVCALALRPQIVGIGPLAPQIQRDLGASHALVGLLGTLYGGILPHSPSTW